jgi:hypothetical protein
MNFAHYLYFDGKIKLLRYKRIWSYGMIKFSRTTWCNVGEINENDEAFMTKLSSVYSVKYKVSSSFTELIARSMNPLQPLSALRDGAPVSEAQLTVHKIPLQLHTEPPRHVP